MEYFATAPRGVNDLLCAELEDLGATGPSDGRGGVRFNGDLATAYRACLWSRLANRILMPIAAFPAPSADALYDGIRHVDWSQHLASHGSLAVDVNLSASALTHDHYAALKIKDAVVDQFRDNQGERPAVDTARPDIRINCYIQRDQASVYLDLSGTSLHQRNYRLNAGKAPLKENLAAAILLRAGWPAIATEEGAFVDLMCGSGTLAIEAALMAVDAAPGLTRDYYGFLGWRGHDAETWSILLEEARSRRARGLARLPAIFGFDKDRRVLSIARENARRAGLADRINFEYQDIRRFRHSFPPHGLMVTNPPYGKRLAGTGELGDLYSAIGQVLKANMRGWKAAIFTEDQSLGKYLGMRADKIHSLYNGAIACKLIHFNVDEKNDFTDRHLPRAVAEAELSEQAEMFRNRLEKNLRQRKRRADREGISCFRVYDADLPDFAAAIDLYRGDETWTCIQEYEAPSSIDPAKARLRSRELITVTQAVLDLDDAHTFYKTRTRQQGDSQYNRMDNMGRFHTVTEGECRLLVNFEDYLDTGLFLDHRPLRLRLGKEARGKSFLNLFAYTCAATVHAAVGGAARTTSVDMSATYLDWGRRNLAANGIEGAEHELVRADCLKWLNEQKGKSWDLVFLDPPTFSNSKRMEGVLDTQRDHPALVRAAMALLAPNGKLYFSTNARQFKLDPSLQEDFDVRDITSETIPFDFQRRANIHRCFMMTHR